MKDFKGPDFSTYVLLIDSGGPPDSTYFEDALFWEPLISVHGFVYRSVGNVQLHT